MKLYNYWRSSASWRVRWALELKNIPYEYVAVNLLKKEQSSETSLRRNPFAGAVPTLEVMPGILISESLAIIEWLEESFPNQRTKLLPQDPVGRAKARQLFEILNSGTQPYCGPLFVGELFPGDENQQKRQEWTWKYFDRGFKAYQEISQPYRKEFSLGSGPMLPDLALIPQIYNALRFDYPISERFPELLVIHDRAASTAECQRAHPQNQPDAPKP